MMSEENGRAALMQTGTLRPLLFAATLTIVGLGGAGVWSALAPLESAAMAAGTIVVESNRKTVAHLEGGVVAQILVRVFPDDPPQARATAREKIEAILKEVKSGGDFADLAHKYSDDRETRGGDGTGWVARGKGPPAIERIAFALQPGQTSDVIESRLGFHILKVLEKRSDGPIPYDQAKKAIRTKLVARERVGKIRAYVDELKEQARIERGPKATS